MKNKVLTLLVGSGAGQAIQFLCLPLISRLFSPEAIGGYGALLAISALFATLIGLRLEVDYLRIPASERDSLTKTFLYAAAGMSLVIWSLLSLGAGESFIPDVWGSSYYLHFMIVALSLTLAFFEYNIVVLAVESKIKRLAILKGVRGGSTSLLQVIGGLLGLVGMATLVVADLMVRAFSSFNNGFGFFKARVDWRYIFSFDRLKLVFSALLGKLSLNAPYLIIGAVWGGAYVGFYFVTQRSLGAAMALLGKSISSAYISEISEDLKEKERRAVWVRIKEVTKKSFLFSFPFFLGAALAGYFFIESIFGEDWKEFGLAWLLITPLYIVRFCFSPMSQTLNYIGYSAQQFWWEAFRLSTISSALFAPLYFELSFEATMFLYGTAATMSYIVLYILVWLKTGREAF